MLLPFATLLLVFSQVVLGRILTLEHQYTKVLENESPEADIEITSARPASVLSSEESNVERISNGSRIKRDNFEHYPYAERHKDTRFLWEKRTVGEPGRLHLNDGEDMKPASAGDGWSFWKLHNKLNTESQEKRLAGHQYNKVHEHKENRIKHSGHNDIELLLRKGKRKSDEDSDDTGETHERGTEESNESDRTDESEDETDENETEESESTEISEFLGNYNIFNIKKIKTSRVYGKKYIERCPTTGIFPDLKSCQKFYECSKNKIIFYKCKKKSMIYNPILKTCINSNDKHCKTFNCAKKRDRRVPYEQDPKIFVRCHGNSPKKIYICPKDKIFIELSQECKNPPIQVVRPATLPPSFSYWTLPPQWNPPNEISNQNEGRQETTVLSEDQTEYHDQEMLNYPTIQQELSSPATPISNLSSFPEDNISDAEKSISHSVKLDITESTTAMYTIFSEITSLPTTREDLKYQENYGETSSNPEGWGLASKVSTPHMENYPSRNYELLESIDYDTEPAPPGIDRQKSINSTSQENLATTLLPVNHSQRTDLFQNLTGLPHQPHIGNGTQMNISEASEINSTAVDTRLLTAQATISSTALPKKNRESSNVPSTLDVGTKQEKNITPLTTVNPVETISDLNSSVVISTNLNYDFSAGTTFPHGSSDSNASDISSDKHKDTNYLTDRIMNDSTLTQTTLRPTYKNINETDHLGPTTPSNSPETNAFDASIAAGNWTNAKTTESIAKSNVSVLTPVMESFTMVPNGDSSNTLGSNKKPDGVETATSSYGNGKSNTQTTSSRNLNSSFTVPVGLNGNGTNQSLYIATNQSHVNAYDFTENGEKESENIIEKLHTLTPKPAWDTFKEIMPDYSKNETSTLSITSTNQFADEISKSAVTTPLNNLTTFEMDSTVLPVIRNVTSKSLVKGEVSENGLNNSMLPKNSNSTSYLSSSTIPIETTTALTFNSNSNVQQSTLLEIDKIFTENRSDNSDLSIFEHSTQSPNIEEQIGSSTVNILTVTPHWAITNNVSLGKISNKPIQQMDPQIKKSTPSDLKSTKFDNSSNTDVMSKLNKTECLNCTHASQDNARKNKSNESEYSTSGDIFDDFSSTGSTTNKKVNNSLVPANYSNWTSIANIEFQLNVSTANNSTTALNNPTLFEGNTYDQNRINNLTTSDKHSNSNYEYSSTTVPIGLTEPIKPQYYENMSEKTTAGVKTSTVIIPSNIVNNINNIKTSGNPVDLWNNTGNTEKLLDHITTMEASSQEDSEASMNPEELHLLTTAINMKSSPNDLFTSSIPLHVNSMPAHAYNSPGVSAKGQVSDISGTTAPVTPPPSSQIVDQNNEIKDDSYAGQQVTPQMRDEDTNVATPKPFLATGAPLPTTNLAEVSHPKQEAIQNLTKTILTSTTEAVTPLFNSSEVMDITNETNHIIREPKNASLTPELIGNDFKSTLFHLNKTELEQNKEMSMLIRTTRALSTPQPNTMKPSSETPNNSISSNLKTTETSYANSVSTSKILISPDTTGKNVEFHPQNITSKSSVPSTSTVGYTDYKTETITSNNSLTNDKTNIIYSTPEYATNLPFVNTNALGNNSGDQLVTMAPLTTDDSSNCSFNLNVSGTCSDKLLIASAQPKVEIEENKNATNNVNTDLSERSVETDKLVYNSFGKYEFQSSATNENKTTTMYKNYTIISNPTMASTRHFTKAPVRSTTQMDLSGYQNKSGIDLSTNTQEVTSSPQTNSQESNFSLTNELKSTNMSENIPYITSGSQKENNIKITNTQIDSNSNNLTNKPNLTNISETTNSPSVNNIVSRTPVIVPSLETLMTTNSVASSTNLGKKVFSNETSATFNVLTVTDLPTSSIEFTDSIKDKEFRSSTPMYGNDMSNVTTDGTSSSILNITDFPKFPSNETSNISNVLSVTDVHEGHFEFTNAVKEFVTTISPETSNSQSFNHIGSTTPTLVTPRAPPISTNSNKVATPLSDSKPNFQTISNVSGITDHVSTSYFGNTSTTTDENVTIQSPIYESDFKNPSDVSETNYSPSFINISSTAPPSIASPVTSFSNNSNLFSKPTELTPPDLSKISSVTDLPISYFEYTMSTTAIPPMYETGFTNSYDSSQTMNSPSFNNISSSAPALVNSPATSFNTNYDFASESTERSPDIIKLLTSTDSSVTNNSDSTAPTLVSSPATSFSTNSNLVLSSTESILNVETNKNNNISKMPIVTDLLTSSFEYAKSTTYENATNVPLTDVNEHKHFTNISEINNPLTFNGNDSTLPNVGTESTESSLNGTSEIANETTDLKFDKVMPTYENELKNLTNNEPAIKSENMSAFTNFLTWMPKEVTEAGKQLIKENKEPLPLSSFPETLATTEILSEKTDGLRATLSSGAFDNKTISNVDENVPTTLSYTKGTSPIPASTPFMHSTSLNPTNYETIKNVTESPSNTFNQTVSSPIIDSSTNSELKAYFTETQEILPYTNISDQIATFCNGTNLNESRLIEANATISNNSSNQQQINNSTYEWLCDQVSSSTTEHEYSDATRTNLSSTLTSQQNNTENLKSNSTTLMHDLEAGESSISTSPEINSFENHTNKSHEFSSTSTEGSSNTSISIPIVINNSTEIVEEPDSLSWNDTAQGIEEQSEESKQVNATDAHNHTGILTTGPSEETSMQDIETESNLLVPTSETSAPTTSKPTSTTNTAEALLNSFLEGFSFLGG